MRTDEVGELDILRRQAIEQNKRLLQIWHGVTKADVEAKYLGLVGLLSIDSSGGIRAIIGRIAAALGGYSDSVSGREGGDPAAEARRAYNFHLRTNGQFRPEDFRLTFEGQLYTRKDLAVHVGRALNDDPAKVQRWLSSPDQLKTLWDICKEEGINPEECV